MDKREEIGQEWLKNLLRGKKLAKRDENGRLVSDAHIREQFDMLEPTPLQRKVCNEAIARGLVEPNDAIEYTYSNARLKEMENGYIKKQNLTDNNIMSTLKCNPQQIGVCVEGGGSHKGSEQTRIRHGH